MTFVNGIYCVNFLTQLVSSANHFSDQRSQIASIYQLKFCETFDSLENVVILNYNLLCQIYASNVNYGID